MRLNGRGVAAADADNDGRMDVAINTIGGKLVLLRPTGPSGNWIDVSLSRFVPGAVVSATLPDGRTLVRTIQAGSSYLSSEDPRVHFGLGSANTAVVHVRYPWGATTETNARADRIVRVAVPPLRTPLVQPAPAACTPAQHAGSIATVWDETAVAVLRAGDASEPVQARDLYDLATAMSSAAPSPTAISYAAYQLLLWRASFNSNLTSAFAILTKQLRSLCLSPDAPANRIAAAAIAAGRRDGSNEALHYADPSFVSQNAPLPLTQVGSSVHDPTFWQPLTAQRFVDAQWGGIRTFAGRVHVGKPPFGIPSSASYKDAAIAVLRATSRANAPRADTSPLAWNRIAATVATGNLAQDLRLYRTLNGALNDAAVSAWAAKREYQAPRPVSMIRYLAFNGQLPIVVGVSKRVGGNDVRPLAGTLDPRRRVDIACAHAGLAGLGVGRERVRLCRGQGADGVDRPLLRSASASPRNRRRRGRHRDARGRIGRPRARHEGRDARACANPWITRDCIHRKWSLFKGRSSSADKVSVVDIEFETVGVPATFNPLLRTLADAGVASEEELQQGSEGEGAVAEGSLAWMERELDSAAAQLAAVRERVGHLREHEDGRERELLLLREQNAKLREARLADAVRAQALETQLAERNQQAAAIAGTLAEAARALGAS